MYFPCIFNMTNNLLEAMKKILFFAFALVFFLGNAQDYFPTNSRVLSNNSNYTAIRGADVYTDAETLVKNATILIHKGMVVNVGKNVKVPANTVTYDMKGYVIYPSFIELFSSFGIPNPKRAAGSGRSPQYDATREGYYWNDHIRPEVQAFDLLKYSAKDAAKLRSMGFGTVNSHNADGIARGNGALITLNDKGNNASRLLHTASGQYFSFSKSVTSRQSYPGSLMGSQALLRQVNHDLRWYSQGLSDTRDKSLEAMLDQQNQPYFFEAGDRGNAFKAAKIAQQFGQIYNVLGGGDEFEHLELLKKYNTRLVVPVNFPKAYDVSDPINASYVNLSDLRFWEQAPSNLAILENEGFSSAISSNGLSASKSFFSNLRKAMERGASKEFILKGLTQIPAQMLKQENSLGQLQEGFHANFIVTKGDLFAKDFVIYENWVQGEPHILEDRSVINLKGDYSLEFKNHSFEVSISGSSKKPNMKVTSNDISYKSEVSYDFPWLNFTLSNDEGKLYRFQSRIDDASSFSGRVVANNGMNWKFNAQKASASEDEKKKDKKKNTVASSEMMSSMRFPNVGMGKDQMPKSEHLLFKNATVWTGEEILEQTDVHIKNGKIVAVGKNLNARGAQQIDATGKHLTAGIVDEHSHIGAFAINEGGQNSSAEVRMADVVDAKDIDIYRNLAGGVTTIQLLHGSANPIGGQSAILRLKWGNNAEDLLFEGADPYIKFALGENVKQSNWQSFARFPQTRMGVEQIFVDYFTRAEDYMALKESGAFYRVDEELETLSEILRGERFISCHSYVQSEINMLMKVADRFGFRVNTFTHILEGYKVADKMKEHGVGGSTFSDWWAYKYEVKDAIPYNAAIMSREGVTVAINSDDAEMSRRLNQEAAKTVKYGGLSEIEAWKMVTLNPAKLLHIDDKVGSIAVGKEADVVLWSDHPLSIYAYSEKTLIQGQTFFDFEKDKELQERNQKERMRLIKAMLNVTKKEGGETQIPIQNKKRHFECETI